MNAIFTQRSAHHEIPIIPLLPLFCLAALPAGAMTLKSTDIREGEPMDKVFSFNGFGCSGENRSPVELAEPARRHPERRHHRL